MNQKNWLTVGLSLLFAYLIVLQVTAIWPFTIDDMFISLRYAKHWAAGEGLVWNSAEEPVEGYSNFSFVALASLFLRWHWNPLILLKGLGVVSLILSSGAIYGLTRFFLPFRFAIIPCLWLLYYRGEILWSVSGLETIPFQACIAFALLCLLLGMGYRFYPSRRETPQTKFLISAGLLLALGGITRPETPILMVLFAVLAWWDSPKSLKKQYRWQLGKGCLSAFLCFLPYFLWRWHYYGYLFPNPVYCKSFGFLGVLDKKYLQLAFPFMLLSLPAFLKIQGKIIAFFCLPSGIYLLLLLNADPMSSFENRLFLPVFSLLLPLAALGLATLCRAFCVKEESSYFAFLVSAFLFAFFLIPSYSLKNYHSFAQNPQAGMALRQEVLAWLDEHVNPQSRVVLADCGQIPYFSSLKYIDSYCLNNKAMIQFPAQTRYQQFCEQVFRDKPQVLILTSWSSAQSVRYTPADACLHSMLQTNKEYQYRTVFAKEDRQQAYRYEIYTLKD